MTNQFKTFITLLFLSILTINTAQAALITWQGGTGAWDNPSRWDTGTVPTFNDDVFILAGSVILYNGDYASARSVSLQSNAARLYLLNGSNMTISGAVDNNGLNNEGRVYIYGKLTINSISQTNISFEARAINNENYIYAGYNSVISIKYIDDYAIFNDDNAYFRLRGQVDIYSIGHPAIYNQERFYNSGVINITAINFSGGGGAITNAGEFRNYSTGDINIDSDDIFSGFANAENALLDNYGEISISEIGISNKGTFNNYNGATVEVEYSGFGFLNEDTGVFNNMGLLTIQYCNTGFDNFGTIDNQFQINLFYSITTGIINHDIGIINNHSNLLLASAGFRDIFNEGIITNHGGGYLVVDKVIDFNGDGQIINNGFLISTLDGLQHYITTPNDLINNGAIEDDNNSFPGIITNNQLIVKPVIGPMTVGVPFPNVLEVTSLTNVTLGDWKTLPIGGVIAGTYYAASNKFIPNANAVGLSTIYISVTDNATGNSRNFTLEIVGGINAVSANPNTSITAQNDPTFDLVPIYAQAITTFPNPTRGQLQIKTSLFETKPTQVQLLNSLGQIVQQTQWTTGAINQSFQFSSHLSSGVYYLSFLQDGGVVETKRVVLER